MNRGARLIGLMVLALRPAILGAAPEAKPPHAGAVSSCLKCHAGLEGDYAQPAALWPSDVHAAAGLGCESCHGGDPSPRLADSAEEAMNPSKGFSPPPDRLHVADACARCHASAEFMKRYNPKIRVDQLAEYRTSVHGQLNAKGDATPATCIDCHGAHGIRPVTSPDSPVYATNVPATCGRCHSDAKLMAPYGIKTNQLDEYRRSVHASALLDRGDAAAPACNDCHGNHGATPPGVKSVANVCGQCHGREAMLFEASFKKDLFEGMGVPACITCHDHHLIRHPTPELFHGGSSPQLARGRVISSAPFEAEIGDLAAGEKATASWRIVIKPHPSAEAARLAHRIEIDAVASPPIILDATVRPGDRVLAVRTASAGEAGPRASLTIEALSGFPVEAGDAISMRLDVDATPTAPLRGVHVRDLPGPDLDPLAGSACRSCHQPGDACDQASEKMYRALGDLDHDLRDAGSLLRRAELAGMEVSGPLFELKSKGTTAAVESRALIHSFEPDRLVQRTAEGRKVAGAALESAKAALAELQFRREGLGVSLGLVALVLLGIFLKIRNVDRERREESARKAPAGQRI